MRAWDAHRVAEAADATLVAAGEAAEGPSRAVIDSREAGPGDLFFGLAGENVDGGRFAAKALEQGAWGVVVAPEHAEGLQGATGVVLAVADPLAALQHLATSWRRALGATVIGVTGSTGKTSTKDVLAAMVGQEREVVATPKNLNTEIGLPLTILGAPGGTEVLVLEMAMRGAGQIAELAEIAEPDVGLITNVGPVHLELLGSIEAIAKTKAELIGGLRPGGTAIIPEGEELLAPYVAGHVSVVTFGSGGDVDEDDLDGIDLPFGSAHMRQNAMAALAAARAAGVEPHGRIEVALSELRGQRITVPGDVTIVNDCYNANPMSMRAALDDLMAAEGGRRVAVLGDMLELGPDEVRFHEEIGAHARERGVEVLVTVGPLARHMHGDHAVDTAQEAAELLPTIMREGDTILVKASRGVGLEVVAESLLDQGFALQSSQAPPSGRRH